MPDRVDTADRRTDPRWLSAVLLAMIASAFLVLMGLAFRHNVNWDEFYFLSQVHDWLQGRLDRPMQTFFVHGFGWLAKVSLGEMQQILAARLVMLACLAGTCLAIYRISVRLTGRVAAQVAVLVFLTSGYVLPHGASFRADPMAACLLMTAVSLTLTPVPRFPHWATITVLTALSLLVTIKSVFYLPVFMGLLWYRRHEARFVWSALMSGIAAMALAALAHVWHASLLTIPAGNETLSRASDALFTAILSGSLFPRHVETEIWILFSLPAVSLCLLGLKGLPDRIVLSIALCLPLLSVLFYRNAFPYFFPFITPPLMVVAALGAQRARQAGRLAPVFLACLASGAFQTLLAAGEDTSAQRATLAEVHRLFPEPVPYVEGFGLVASFPHVGPFLSGWGIARYQADGIPVFPDLIRDQQPPLLIANRRHLALAVQTGGSPESGLLPEDQRILHDTYVHYAGPIWLAGHTLVGTAAADPFDIRIAGDYRIEAPTAVILDGAKHPPASTVTLSIGQHHLLAPQGAKVTLVWAAGGRSASAPDLPDGPVYAEFWDF